MLAVRCPQLRFWPKTSTISAFIPCSIRSDIRARIPNGCQRFLGIKPPHFIRSSSSSRSAAKIIVEQSQSRHAEISAYVEKLSAQDVQVFLFGCLIPSKSEFAFCRFSFMRCGCVAKYRLQKTRILHPSTKKLHRALLWQIWMGTGSSPSKSSKVNCNFLIDLLKSISISIQGLLMTRQGWKMCLHHH
jgi:hypothetical protein